MKFETNYPRLETLTQLLFGTGRNASNRHRMTQPFGASHFTKDRWSFEGVDGGNNYNQTYASWSNPYISMGMKGHNGIDFDLVTGDKVFSPVSGRVFKTSKLDDNGYGYTVRIEDGVNEYIFAHLSDFSLKVNDRVNVGDLIGLGGNTGFSTGSHLHFGVRPKNKAGYNDGYYAYFDPMLYPFEQVLVQKNWYDEYMDWASDMNIMTQGRPEEPVNRAEVAAIIKRLYDKIQKN